MKKLSMRIELEYYDGIIGDDDYARQWLDEVLLEPKDVSELQLFSTDVGDSLGQVRVIEYHEIKEGE